MRNIWISSPLKHVTFKLFLTSQVYISETSNGMKTVESMHKVIFPLHSHIFRYNLFQFIFDILHFLKHGKNINVLSTQKNHPKAHSPKC